MAAAVAATATRRAAARSKATEASGLAGLARDGINGGNDWGRLRGLESVASHQDAPPTNSGGLDGRAGSDLKKTAGGRIRVGTIPSEPSVARAWTWRARRRRGVVGYPLGEFRAKPKCEAAVTPKPESSTSTGVRLWRHPCRETRRVHPARYRPRAVHASGVCRGRR